MNSVIPTPTDVTLTPGVVGAAKASEIVTDSVVAEGRGPARHLVESRPIRMVFTIQYTELGMEQLYSELSVLSDDLERTRHVKRILLDIARKSFKRPAAARPALGSSDQESFRIQIRLSLRDVGLEDIYGELKAQTSTFSRNCALRRILYDAFNFSASRPSSGTTGGQLATVEIQAVVTDPPIDLRPALLPHISSATDSSTRSLTERRNAARASARQSNRGHFESN